MINATNPIATSSVTLAGIATQIVTFEDGKYTRGVITDPAVRAKLDDVLDALYQSGGHEVEYFKVEARLKLRFDPAYRKADDATKESMIGNLANAMLAQAKTKGFSPKALIADETGQTWLFHETFSTDTSYQRAVGVNPMEEEPALIFTACDVTGHAIVNA